MRSYLLLFALVATAAACSAPEAEEPVQTAPAVESTRRVVRVQTQVLEATDFEDVIQLTGTVEAPNDATLSAQSGGTIESIVSLGRSVRSGEVVAELDDVLIRATLDQTRAQLDVARAQEALAAGLLRRQEPLYRDSIISDLEFENVRTQAIQAQAERSRAEALVSQVEKQLENTRVRAPFDGTVEERFAEKGEQVMPGAPILRVVNTSTIRITAGVPERYASDVRVGSDVTVGFSSYSVAERTSKVTFASRVIDPQNRSFRIEMDLSNPGGRLKPAMIANLHIVRERLADRIVIPQTAVMRDENDQSVFVVVPDDQGAHAERRSVTLGPSFGGQVVVEAGLAAGDQVIVVGQTNVTEGDAIEVAPTGQEG